MVHKITILAQALSVNNRRTSTGFIKVEGDEVTDHPFEVHYAYGIKEEDPGFVEYNKDNNKYGYRVITPDLDPKTLKAVGIIIDFSPAVERHKELVNAYEEIQKKEERIKRETSWSNHPMHIVLITLHKLPLCIPEAHLDTDKEKYMEGTWSDISISVDFTYTATTQVTHQINFTIEQNKRASGGYKLRLSGYGEKDRIFGNMDNLKIALIKMKESKIQEIETLISNAKKVEEDRKLKENEIGYKVINIQKYHESGFGRNRGSYYHAPTVILNMENKKKEEDSYNNWKGKAVSFYKNGNGTYTINKIEAVIPAITFKTILDLLAKEGIDVSLSSEYVKEGGKG